MNKTTTRVIALLISLASIGVLIFQVNWLTDSYRVSREKTRQDISNIVDASIRQHKSQAADSVRKLMSQIIHSDKDFVYGFMMFKGRVSVSFRTPEQNTIIDFPVPEADTFMVKQAPRTFLMRQLSKADLDELYPIYSTLVGTRVYDDESADEKTAVKLMQAFKWYGDTSTLKAIIKRRFQLAGIPFQGSLHYYTDIQKLYHLPVPVEKPGSKTGSQIVEMVLGASRETLARKLDKLNTYVNEVNSRGDRFFTAKPLLYDINDILMDNIPVLALSVSVPGGFLVSKMLFNIIASIVLLLCVGLCVAYMLRTIIKQKKLADIKSDFISNITHELKTPVATALAAVQGLQYFDVLKDPQKTSSYLDTAANEIKRLSLMINKIISVSVFDDKGFQLNPSAFNLKEMLAGIIAGQQIRQEKAISINLDYQAPEELFADRQHLQNVIVNLIDNAINYSGDKVHIDIQCSNINNTLHVRVSDNGIGVAPEYRKTIFDKFSRVPGTNTRGYGLGLNYVKQILERHNGNIALAKTSPDGSVFIINLPQ